MELFYQKYRPRKIAELDLELVRRTLGRILAQKNVPHAFLFAGPKGIGKTSAARILAKSLNCLNAKNGEPCGKCDVCLEIGRGESLDILEIDAASNRGIDDIRQLKEKINLRPIKARSKVYIVDEVHMLTREAFNAFLKTLEEPPPHVYFVFCTTNPEKIPETVLSRLTRIDFHRASEKEVTRALKRAIKGEKLKINEKVLKVIAQTADGSCRDGHKILYQLWLEGGGKITAKEAGRVLKRWQESSPWYLLKLIFQLKIKKSVLLLEKLTQLGIDWQDYGRRLMEALKELLLVEIGGIKTKKKEVKDLEAHLSRGRILLLGEVFQRAIVEAKNSSIPQLSFQLAVVDFFERLSLSGKKGKGSVVSMKEERSEKGKKEDLGREQDQKKLSPNPGRHLDLSVLKDRWTEFLEVVKPMNHSVSAFLRACRPKQIEGQYLILEVFYQFHKDQLEQERNRRIVEEALGQIFQTSLRVKCELSPRPSSSTENKTSPIESKVNNEGTVKKGDDLYEIAKEIFGE